MSHCPTLELGIHRTQNGAVQQAVQAFGAFEGIRSFYFPRFGGLVVGWWFRGDLSLGVLGSKNGSCLVEKCGQV